MAEHLNPEEENLLQSALETAFSPAPLPKQSAASEQPAEAAAAGTTSEPPAPEPESAEPSASSDADDVWKAEYNEHVAEWRRQSADQREHAEQERQRWEEIRARERAEGIARSQVHSESGWESVGGSASASLVLESATSTQPSVEGKGGEPSVAGARHLMSGEHQGKQTKEQLEKILPGTSHTAAPTSENKDKWESLSSSPAPDSLTSSYPSLSFPSDAHSPSSLPASLPHQHQPGQPHHTHGPHHDEHHHHHAHAAQEAPSTTLAIFDSSLSPRTRVRALLASIAVNILLPFVNGVMLGFGEIYAKEVVVGWFGFGRKANEKRRRAPGSREASVGLRSGSAFR
ncbi:uncharacterized protein LAESUDRAFT_758248 [Laetiporus sulphureus 93-53]|uniref:TOM13-domain-containing protein n=1 Tax=Laetiporus sulphureus 93-53 TaxID=1314785 RepID=A0A165ESH6_9APHY|nr:uncharacterized protein LAESUDRAFT_758248 [Laetiporus sulphureus 93-53]KZT07669.1 hypothetical protein LAESUDRAFT_758248 [Laetiporus sulphureus 93-53]